MKRIVNTGRVAKRIVNTGKVAPKIDPAVFARALGAEPTGIKMEGGGSPVGVFALRRELESRLRSSGGRPGLAGTDLRPKIPLSEAEWKRLESIAGEISESGVTTSPGQVASVILHMGMKALEAAEATPVAAYRRAHAELTKDLAEIESIRNYVSRISDRSKWIPALAQSRSLFASALDRLLRGLDKLAPEARPAEIERRLESEASRLHVIVDLLRQRIAEAVDPAGTREAKAHDAPMSRV